MTQNEDITFLLSLAYLGNSLEKSPFGVEYLKNKDQFRNIKKDLGFSLYVAELDHNNKKFNITFKEIYADTQDLMLERIMKQKKMQNSQFKAVVDNIMHEIFQGIGEGYKPKEANLDELEKAILNVGLGKVEALIIDNSGNNYSDDFIKEVVDVFKNVNGKKIISVKKEGFSDVVVDSLDDAVNYMMDEITKDAN